MIPKICHPATDRHAECRLFGLLPGRLPNALAIMYAVPILLRKRPDPLQESEIDFWIAHAASAI